jgi:PAS domain S-box-containing protein
VTTPEQEDPSSRAANPGQELLRRAENALAAEGGRETEALPPAEDVQRLLHDLRVHQIELEMQNDELRRTQEELEASRQRYFDLYDLAPVGYVTLCPKGLVVEANLCAVELLGVPRSDLIEQRLSSFVLPEDQDAWYLLLRNRRSSTSEPKALELRLVRQDGTRFWARLDVSFEDGGQIRLVLSDITERKLAEDERRSLEAEVQQAQKLESLGVLAGGIAHDFNNLLVGILGNADLAYDDLPAHSPVRPLISEILKASTQAAGLTNQMLAYSGKGHFVVQTLDLGALVRDMGSLLVSSISKKVGLRYELTDDLPAIKADASQLQQIVMNLVTNASQAFGEGGGLITIRSGTTECDSASLCQTQLAQPLPEGRYVFLEISDAGSGMNEETKAKIFDPFFTTKPEGRGLGLAAVQGIVRGHGGAILVQSEPGVGSTLRVLLPALDYTISPSRTRAAPESEDSLSGTVLVVDDVKMVRDLATRVLKRLGLTVLSVSDGVQAVELFRERHAEVDCVLLDLKMPHMDGQETFKELRKIRGDVPVILSSGYSEKESTRQFGGEGLAGFIQKPYELATGRAKLREVLGG